MAGSWDRSKKPAAYSVSSLGATTQPKIGVIRSGQVI
jgi:hypothetical protein